jgi:hypothetical protein
MRRARPVRKIGLVDLTTFRAGGATDARDRDLDPDDRAGALRARRGDLR